MKDCLLQLCVISVLCQGIVAQSSYRVTQEQPVTKFRTLDLSTVQQREGYIEYQSRPKPGGDAYHTFLHTQKQKAMAMFPETGRSDPRAPSSVEPPQLIRSFSGNGFAGIPLDNHLAVNRQDQVVSVVNTHMLVCGPTGVWQRAYSLDDFWSPLGESDFYFDPRVMYDPVADRFIIAMMQDFTCAGSNIVFAFSATPDPTGVWHLYRFDGCPKADNTFADFPMIAISQDELFFTYNAVYQDSSWQNGFSETLIYQINKADGYNGEDLRWKSWSDIRHDNRKLRYMCPVKYGAGMSTGIYLLSNRSFDVQNDTVFLLHLNGNLEDPDPVLTIQPLISDSPYGVPPNARQPMDWLQTNDARVLDAFIVDDHIQFVNNTIDPGTGRCVIYHGLIEGVSSAEPLLSGVYLHNGSEHFGYPAIAYTGDLLGERDAIIIAGHASLTRFPGYSALYFNEGYSNWITVVEGQRNIDMLKVGNPFGLDPTLERWGDYSGIQRQYNETGTVYTSSSYGRPGSINDTWIGYLSRPEGDPSSIHDATSLPVDGLTVFPNPVRERVTIAIATDHEGKTLVAELFTADGNKIGTVHRQRIAHGGPMQFHYDISHLATGTYVMVVSFDGVQAGSRRFVVQ